MERLESGMEKIVFVIPDMPGGGTERVVALLANEYCKRGIETAVLLFAGHETAYRLDERVEVVSIGMPTQGSFRARIERIRKMRQYYKENKNCQIWSLSVTGMIFSVLAAWGQRHAFLVSERSDPGQYEHPRLRNFFYRFADVVVCQTKEAREYFPQSIRKKSVVISNPLDMGGAAPYDGEREKRVVAVGRLVEVKNYELLIQAFARFIEAFPDYTLEFYGIGEREAKLKALAKELGIAPKVIFHGFSDRVQAEIRKAAIYVTCSNYEGLSNSLMEAVALGVPVIATDCPIGGSKMCIENEKSGLLIPVGEIEPLVQAMKRLAGDPAFAGKLGLEGRKLRETNRVDKIADCFLQAVGGENVYSVFDK